MATFEEMAKAAREKHSAETRAIADRQAQARIISEQRYLAAVALLEENVLPIMTEAQEAFGRAGAPATITPNWTGQARYDVVSVSFKLKGPVTPVRATGGTYEPEGPVVIARVLEEAIEISLGKNAHDHFGTALRSSDWRATLTEAIGKAVEGYYESIERITRQHGE